MDNRINIRNKKAYFDYEIIEKLVAGMQLTGTEIKSIRMGKASLADAYCLFRNNEIWVKNLRIFISENGYAKLEIALARGKKKYDKREAIKQKDMKRDMERLGKTR